MSGIYATILKSGARGSMDINHSCPTSRLILYGHGSRVFQALRWSPKDNRCDACALFQRRSSSSKLVGGCMTHLLFLSQPLKIVYYKTALRPFRSNMFSIPIVTRHWLLPASRNPTML